MVAPAKRNGADVVGYKGDPIRRTVGSTWTERELRALNREAKFASRAKVIRSLIDQKKLAAMIRRTEAAAQKTQHN